MRNESTFSYEQSLADQRYDFVIGIDEAGRGPLAGPVTAAAVAWRKLQIPNNLPRRQAGKSQIKSKSQIQNSKRYELIRDSKTLSEKQREGLYDFICENFYVGIGICDHRTIDRINILEATYLSMKMAVTSLMKEISNSPNKISNNKLQITNKSQIPIPKFQTNSCIILVDGNKVIPNLSIEQKAIVNGDKIVKSISAASIVAKVTRDRLMREFHEKYPEYCFDRHKGYGTKIHLEALKRHGICEIHRKSFEPVKSWTKVGRSAKLESEI